MRYRSTVPIITTSVMQTIEYISQQTFFAFSESCNIEYGILFVHFIKRGKAKGTILYMLSLAKLIILLKFFFQIIRHFSI
jgi:hypothetical protein